MPTDIALDSTTAASDYTRDADDLKALKLEDGDLDHFAAYFELAFQGNSQGITVLVALLQRLGEVENLRKQKQSGIWFEDIFGRLKHRLYTRSEPAIEAASRFGTEANELAEHIFAEVLRS